MEASARSDFISSSKLKVIAALIEARGSIPLAARMAGVSKQYIYEVLKGMKSIGIKLRYIPSFSALGRVFLTFTYSGNLPSNDLTVFRLKVYTFDGSIGSVAVYVLPNNLSSTAITVPRNATIIELIDVFPSAPWTHITELRSDEDRADLKVRATTLDEEDKAILAALYEDFSAPVTGVLPGVSKSRLSYHFRLHVKPLLRVFLDTHPLRMHAKPLIFSEVRAVNEGWLSALLKAREVYLVMPKKNSLVAYVLLDLNDTFVFLKEVSTAIREKGLGLHIKLLGYVDPDESEKVRIPRVFTPVYTGLRTE